MATTRATAPHGSPLKSLYYRDMHFRVPANIVEQIHQMSGETGMSFSSIMLLALEQLFATKGDSLLPITTSFKDDDPSNPLG